MSLLNDMLNDLNSRAPHRSEVVFMPRAQRSWRAFVVLGTLGVLITVLSVVAVLLMPLPHHEEQSVLAKAPVSTIAPVAPVPPAPMQEAHEVMIKQNVTLNDSYETQLNEALDAIQEGEDPRAIAILTQLLSDFPQSIEARENLVGLYFAHGKMHEAHTILEEGLAFDSHNLRLMILKSRWLVEQGEHREALALLEQFNPNMRQYPDYYATLAAIFNALGRIDEAGSLYQALLRMDPSNGQYYLGLGIALEHKHAIQQAIEAYKQARGSEDIQPAARTYAEHRLNVLQG